MKDLQSLINKFGQPDALIDNHVTKKYGYAIWGFKDIFKYDSSGTYLNNKKIIGDSLENTQKFIDTSISENDLVSCIGFISYDIKNIFYPHLKFKSINSNFPYIWFAKPELVIRYDINSKIYTEYEQNFLVKIKDIDHINKYKLTIDKIKKELKAGNTYQINLTMQKLYKSKVPPFDIYSIIRQIAKPAFGYYINNGINKILSFSPEEFFDTSNGIIHTYPMKGTKKRSLDQEEDKKLKQELSNSKKDQAEHLMIVDLLRNDIGKICTYGSVKVKDLFKVNSYETIHQIVTHIYGKIKPDINHMDIFRALCPGGSITGAPKESSMKIIDYLENYNREIYTGNIGYINGRGDMAFNMAIRTLSINSSICKYPVGGGIVWDSTPADEWEEAQLKSKILEKFIR